MIYNVEHVNEFFGHSKKSENNKKQIGQKIPRKYEFLTEEEFNKCMSIIKKNINKYSILRDITVYSTSGIYSTYSEYKKFNGDDVCVAMIEFGHDNVPEDKMDEYNNQYDKVFSSIKEELERLPFKVSCETVGDSEWDIICLNVRKSKTENMQNLNNDEKKKSIKEACLAILSVLDDIE